MVEKRRKPGGAKLSRSETVTVRLDPKLRYFAELAARKHRRTLSSFIEWAVEDVVRRVNLHEGSEFSGETNQSIGDEAGYLWDVDEADRFAKLALHYPELLTHEEQVIWKIIKENGYFWRGSWSGTNSAFEWHVEDCNFIFERLREHWNTVKQVGLGEKPISDLPFWNRHKKDDDKNHINAVKKTFDFMDDDIPF